MRVVFFVLSDVELEVAELESLDHKERIRWNIVNIGRWPKKLIILECRSGGRRYQGDCKSQVQVPWVISTDAGKKRCT